MADHKVWKRLKENADRHYSTRNIMETKADYYLTIGERSNGKTYAYLEYILKMYLQSGEEGFYIRRRHSDVVRSQCIKTWVGHIQNGLVSQYSGGKYNDIVYKPMLHAWYMRNIGKDGVITEAETPFCYCTSLDATESFKGGQFPGVKNILFDEFIPMKGNTFLYEEWSLFQNTLSTIIRDRGDVKIFLVGNTVSPHNNPYFKNMGLTHAKEMKPGTIDVYTFKDGKSIAVEYTLPNKDGKASDRYFAFDNADSMIINGEWALAVYPKRSSEWGRIRPSDILLTYFIIYEDETLQCEVINQQNVGIYTFIHKKTTPIKDETKELIYSLEYSPRPNWHRKLNGGAYTIDSKLYSFFNKGKVFYQDNETGDMVEGYLNACLMEK